MSSSWPSVNTSTSVNVRRLHESMWSKRFKKILNLTKMKVSDYGLSPGSTAPNNNYSQQLQQPVVLNTGGTVPELSVEVLNILEKAIQPPPIGNSEKYFTDPIVNYLKKVVFDIITKSSTIDLSERDQNRITHISELLRTYLKEHHPSIVSPDKGDSL